MEKIQKDLENLFDFLEEKGIINRNEYHIFCLTIEKRKIEELISHLKTKELNDMTERLIKTKINELAVIEERINELKGGK